MKPYCFVLMPFGKKPVENRPHDVDFDAVYSMILAPAIVSADLEPIRADEEKLGGFIHKPLFERLMICDYAIADITSTNANVFYELGIRHGIRPHSTVLVYAAGTRLPFDVAPLRAIPYTLDERGIPSLAEDSTKVLAERLNACKMPVDDSPLYQLITDIPRIDISRLKTDTFRERVTLSEDLKQQLSDARSRGREAVAHVHDSMRPLTAQDHAIQIDLLLSYRAVQAHSDMLTTIGEMSVELSGAILVREQRGFALNRMGRHMEAEQVLQELIERHGANSETNGLLGRVYKDMWRRRLSEGDELGAVGYLRKAIKTYLVGFESDWRDAYPGVNALTLMEQLDEYRQAAEELLPVVKYAVKRRIELSPDYWDYATLLELHILEGSSALALKALSDALSSLREPWEAATTAGNIEMIAEAWNGRNRDTAWIVPIIRELRLAGQRTKQ
ncbi:MAG: DUF4071 domain-containing protein [Candidatus Competibacteraceae bacterium]|nr:DUF4071 domain-containing protein [Candidatus Competibacteraceae bacterium]